MSEVECFKRPGTECHIDMCTDPKCDGVDDGAYAEDDVIKKGKLIMGEQSTAATVVLEA